MLLVLIASVPFVLLIFRSADEEREQRHHQVSAQAAQLARVVAQNHRKSIEAARQLLESAAADWDGDLIGPECERRLQWLERATPVNSLSVVDADGTILCSTLPGAAGLAIDDREYFQQALATGRFAVSNLLRGKIGNVDVVAAAQPVAGASGRVEHVLVAGVVFNWLPKALTEVGAPEDFEALIVSGKGDVVARFPESRAGGAAPVARVLGDAPLAGPRGAPDLVRIGLPSHHVDGVAEDALQRGLVVLSAAFGVALLLAWLGSSFFVVSPLRRLAQAAAKLDAGDLSVRTGVPHDGNEIGELARRLDTLAVHRQRTTRALRALSAGNRTLLREQTERELLGAMCRVAVEHGDYALAVVTYKVDDEAKTVAIQAHAGDDRGALQFMRPTWADTRRGRGTIGTAIRSGRTTVLQNIATAPGIETWRDEFVRRGFGSVASMPLRVEGEVIGTLTLYSREAEAFDREELLLIEEMADDLAFGIGVCRARLKHQAAELEVQRIATHDALTGLANRSHFLGLLRQALVQAQREGAALAIVVVHLRDLQALVDGLGYGPGMQVVHAIAQRLRRIVPEGEVLARVPQEDFVVMRGGADARSAAALAQELLEAFATPVEVGDARIDVQGHAGASFFPQHGAEADLLLRRATIASRDAARRDLAFAAYSGITERENPGRLALVADLRRDIEARALQLHFQPKVDLAFGRIIGSEALLRWRHAQKGDISPGQFVPLAEQTGLIRPMTYMVLESAVRQQRAWLDSGLRLPVAVNLSVRNLHDPRLVERIEALLETWRVPAELLELEITEGALVEDPETARGVLARLRAHGCKIYIDDFGTGYSSLSYLVSLPVHALKIDRSFIVQMAAKKEARTVVSSIISMAHGLGLRVVAEGVEREQERDALIALGCDDAQGFLLGRPVPADTFRGIAGF